MISVTALADRIQPEKTVLLLGAGASVPSGAPTGSVLARGLARELTPVPDGDDLTEIASIYENRMGRRPLVTSVRRRLSPLTPTGSLLALPRFGWRAIFTTNFDRLVELSYKESEIDLEVIRSNFDFSRTTPESVTKLFKIHGCISQDIVDGHHGRMLLTERDHDALTKYRETLFSSLLFNMMTCDTLIIGQSLRDSHLRELAKKVSDIKEESTTLGQVFLLSYEDDPDRAELLEQRGLQVASGSLDGLFHALATSEAITSNLDGSIFPPGIKQLPASLAAVTIDVSHSSTFEADPVRLFNGSPATYGDIAGGLTIQRATERRLLEAQENPKGKFLVLTGVAGVGKTCLARRLLFQKLQLGYHCWEHNESFPLDHDAWLTVEESLRKNDERAFLLVDNCIERLTALNKLVNSLGELEDPHLRLVLTANSHQWQSRTKSSFFFSKGTIEKLSQLTESDMEQLINLVEREPRIRELVEPRFSLLTRSQQLRRLRERCSAEMYVCLKNIFGSERLDDILLREYAELSVEEQDVYRHVAVLQAMGSKVHRQLILRLLGIESGTLKGMLQTLEGIVSEYDISARLGLYGWATRHDVIAAAISSYKFSDSDELYDLISRLIDGINPTVSLELDTARSICTTDWGIPRIPEPSRQIMLLRKMISILPGERTPRRRLIRKLLDLNQLDGADQEIQRARLDIGNDSIIDRYRVLLSLQRAESTTGILNEDRIAMLNQAKLLALACINDSPNDRHNYRVLAEVAVALSRRIQDLGPLDEAIDYMLEAEQVILDPELARDRRHFEQTRRDIEHFLSANH